MVSSWLTKYRILQILNDMHNSVFRHPIMSILIWSVTACESFALYTLITSASIVPLPASILFGTVAFDLLILIVGPFKMMADPFIKSIQLLKSVKTMNRSKWIRRFVRSCPPSKLSSGDGKCFDRATSIVICSKCADLVITFLLM